MSILIVVHVIACVGLIFFILIQQGRGGGLIESFTSAESIFGTKTNVLLTKVTTGCAITFFITCLTLAFLSVQQNKSIVQREVKKQTKEAAGVVSETTQETSEEPWKANLEEPTELTDEIQETSTAAEEAAFPTTSQ